MIYRYIKQESARHHVNTGPHNPRLAGTEEGPVGLSTTRTRTYWLVEDDETQAHFDAREAQAERRAMWAEAR